MLDNVHTIDITKLNEMYITYTFRPEAKYALFIDNRVYLTEHLLNKMALSEEYIKSTLAENNIPYYYFAISTREFIIAFNNDDDATKAAGLFKPNLLLSRLKETF